VSVAAGGLEVAGASTEEVGRIAAAERIALTGLTADGASLEDAFLRLTSSDEAPPAARARRLLSRPSARATN
jgi:ABC-2 type transport system ATP-binding protein